MVPYIQVPDLHIGPLPLHPFGILVATGVLVGTSITARRAQKLGYDVLQLNSFVTWMLVSAFVLSHVLDSVFYHWDEVIQNPLYVVKLWEGLSSFGGFVGAVIGIVLWKYFVIDDGKVWPRRRSRPAPILPFADLVLSVFPIGWAFGRAGCATVHDHKGARATADTLLAVAFPRHAGDGTVTKFGFIEFIQGHDVRFAMDFLRIPESERGGDTRYGGLTPAQWSCMALFLYSLFMVFYVRRLRARGVDLSQSLREPAPPASAPVKAL